jgi:hypothetical protein
MITNNVPNPTTVSEETPLLRQSVVETQVHDALYDRFTPAKKRTIVALCAWAGLVPCTLSMTAILYGGLKKQQSPGVRLLHPSNTADCERLGLNTGGSDVRSLCLASDAYINTAPR